MSQRDFHPNRLDVAAFAREAAQLDGAWPLSRFGRLVDVVPADAPAPESDAAGVDWQASGELLLQRGREAQPRLHLLAHTRLWLQCQRCLKPVLEPLEVDRHFLFVHGEDQAAEVDAESEDDVLALTRTLDLRALIEDELLLALPLVPRHEVCGEPLHPGVAAEVALEDAPNPFAALAALKRNGPPN